MCRKTHQAMVFAHSFNPTWFFVHEIRPIWRSHRPLRQAGGNHMFADSGPLDPAKQFLSDSLELPLSFVLALSAYAYQRSVSLVLACLGELVQIDGSEHAWFEDRAEKCTLLAFVDDATSRLMHLRFVASESTFDYFRATRSYLERHGKPVAFYSDKHSIFRVNAKDAAGGDGATQFGRALTELNIDILCANSPQAKGRVERAF